MVLRVTARLLTHRGFEVLSTSHPFEVGSLVRAHHPAAVVLDVNMPGLGGEALSRFLQQQIGPSLPIVFYSGVDDAELRRLAEASSLASYVTKAEGADALATRLTELTG